MFKVLNISSKRNQMLKISDQFCFDLKTLIAVSNPTHRIYSTHNLIKTICVFCDIQGDQVVRPGFLYPVKNKFNIWGNDDVMGYYLSLVCNPKKP